MATCALVYLILYCLFHHTSILGIALPAPILDYHPASNIVEYHVFSAEKGSENPLPPKGKSRLLNDPSPVSYLSTLTLPIPSPVYGIISRCPMYRIQVASDSADSQSVFSCFSNSSDRYQKFNSQLRSSLEYGLDAGSNPRHSSIWVSPPESCYSR